MALGDLEWTEEAWSIDMAKIMSMGGLNPASVRAATPGFAAAQDKGLLDANVRSCASSCASNYVSSCVSSCVNSFASSCVM